MNVSRYPAGWDAERVEKLIDYYEGLSEDEQVAEDEAAWPSRPVGSSTRSPRGCFRPFATSWPRTRPLNLTLQRIRPVTGRSAMSAGS